MTAQTFVVLILFAVATAGTLALLAAYWGAAWRVRKLREELDRLVMSKDAAEVERDRLREAVSRAVDTLNDAASGSRAAASLREAMEESS